MLSSRFPLPLLSRARLLACAQHEIARLGGKSTQKKGGATAPPFRCQFCTQRARPRPPVSPAPIAAPWSTQSTRGRALVSERERRKAQTLQRKRALHALLFPLSPRPHRTAPRAPRRPTGWSCCAREGEGKGKNEGGREKNKGVTWPDPFRSKKISIAADESGADRAVGRASCRAKCNTKKSCATRPAANEGGWET